MHSQKAESIGMCFLPQSESSPIITRHRRTAVQHLRDIPTRQRFVQHTGVRRRKYGRSGVSPNRNASARASYTPVDFRLPLIRPRLPSVHRANRSRRAAEQERKSPRFIRSRRFPASTHPSAVLFGTPREPFPARRRAGTRRSERRRSIPPRRANAPALRPAYRRTPSQVRPFRGVAEQKRKSPRFIRSRRFPASTHPSAVLFGTPREPFPARRRAETQVSALHTLPSVSGFHSSVRGSLQYTARTVPGTPPSRNA